MFNNYRGQYLLSYAKIDTLDALGDEITTILTTNLDNNPDNQFWQQYRQQSEKQQKTIHVEKYNIDIPLICLIFDKISSAPKSACICICQKRTTCLPVSVPHWPRTSFPSNCRRSSTPPSSPTFSNTPAKTRCQIWCTIEVHRDPISKVLSEW